jgi:hypothetical protein
MSNIINEELNRILYLFGYKPGKVISEQTMTDELDEAGKGRRKKINIEAESEKIFKNIIDKVKETGNITFNEIYAISQKFKNTDEYKDLMVSLRDKLKKFDNLSPEDKDKLKDRIFQKVESTGDCLYEESSFISKFYNKEYDYLKTLFSYENPFSELSVKEKVQNYYKKAEMTGKLTDEEKRYLALNARYLLDKLYNKGIVKKSKVGKMSADENQNFEQLLKLVDTIKTQNNITMSQNSKFIVLKRKLSDILGDDYFKEVESIRDKASRKNKKIYSKEEKNIEYDKIKDFVMTNNDIWLSDYYFLKNSNPSLFQELQKYWAKVERKPKPEPVVEPEPETIITKQIGSRGVKPPTPEQIQRRIEFIKNKFSDTKKLENKDYQFLSKYDPELLKTMVRPRKPKQKLSFELEPEEIEYEPMGKLSDYWSSSSTGDYNYKYETP